MLRSHDTKPNWLQLTWNLRNDSCYDSCGDVYSRSPSLAAPQTPIPTLFLTITLSRSHPSLVQIICCERVLTRVTSARSWPWYGALRGVAKRCEFITRVIQRCGAPRNGACTQTASPRDRATRSNGRCDGCRPVQVSLVLCGVNVASRPPMVVVKPHYISTRDGVAAVLGLTLSTVLTVSSWS